MALQWQTVSFNAASDAYVDWLCHGPGSKYPPRFEERKLQILVQLADGKSVSDFAEAMGHAALKAAGTAFRIPEAYLETDKAFLRPQRWFTATVDGAALVALETDARLKDFAERIIISQVLPDDATCQDDASSPSSPSTAGAQAPVSDGTREPDWEVGVVVIGIIDEGIAFANQRFRRSPEDTRVEYAWIQDGRCEHDVEGFHYGRELRKRDHINKGEAIEGIDCLFGRCEFDEEQFYRRAGLSDFARKGHKAAAQRIAHGTHVMDLAAGWEELAEIRRRLEEERRKPKLPRSPEDRPF